MKLAFAIADGEHDEVSADVDAVTEALQGLVASAEAQADALIAASPLAGATRDALARAVADLGIADDVTVDIYYALTDGDYQATGGFTLLASGRGSTGSVSIPIACPVGPGPTSYITVEAVANTPNASAAAYYWGL